MSSPFSFLFFLKLSIICFFVFLSATLTSATRATAKGEDEALASSTTQAIAQGGEERSSSTADPLNIVINEIAWMGTKANSSDEWIELYNNTNQAISLEGWGLYEAGGETLIEPLTGIIEAKSYYLVERTDDTTIIDIPASQEPSSWGGYGLKNSGEHLQLLDQNSTIIDEVNCSDGWFAGEAGPDYKTMERKNPQLEGSDPNNWQTSQNAGGTPKAKNSIVVQAEPQPKPESEKPAGEEPAVEVKLQQTYPAGIMVNEILPSPEGPDDLEEWIELKNLNDKEVNLSQWKIRDTTGSITTYTLPEGTKIGPKGFLVLPRPTTKITLNNSDDGLLLIQPNGNILDTVTYEKAPKGQSYNRTGSGWTWSTTLTPGSENIVPSSTAKEPTPSEELQESQTQKQLAAVGPQIPEPPKSLYIFLTALGLAIFSGAFVLFLKKKQKNIGSR